MKYTEKLTAMALAGLMTFGLSIPALAAPVTTSGGTGTSIVTLEVEENAATFSVTVPTSLPVKLTANGTVDVATNAAITNNSSGRVKITNVAVNAQEGWTVEDYTTDLSDKQVNAKVLALSINGKGAKTQESAMAEAFHTIAPGGTEPVTYQANVPARSSATDSAEEMATVVFTIAWDAVS